MGCNDLEGSSDRTEQSRAIYRFLEKYLKQDAIFGGSFDLPLLTVAYNGDLWLDFLKAPPPEIPEEDEE